MIHPIIKTENLVEKQQMIGLLKWMNKVASEEPMRLEAVEWLEKTIQSMIEHGADLGEDYPALMVHIQQAKEKERQQKEELAFNYFKAGQDSMEEGGKSFDQYNEYNMKQKTAVEWVEEVYNQQGRILPAQFEQAKEEEKQQRENLLLDIDIELAKIEDYAHGEVGSAITKLRGKIQLLDTPVQEKQPLKKIFNEIKTKSAWIDGNKKQRGR
jgi:hypothetical protein